MKQLDARNSRALTQPCCPGLRHPHLPTLADQLPLLFLSTIATESDMDKASEALTRGIPPGLHQSFRTLANHSDVPRTTLQHRAGGRRSIEEKARRQRYLYPWEETALVNFLLEQDAFGRPVRIKYIRSIAFSLARRRALADRPSKLPGRNWPQSFCKSHPELKGSTRRALDWNRFNIHDKVSHWFEVVGTVVQDPGSCHSARECLQYGRDRSDALQSQLRQGACR